MVRDRGLVPILLLALLASMPAGAVQWSVAGMAPAQGVAGRSLAAFSAAVSRGSGGVLTLAPSPDSRSGRHVVRGLAAGKAVAGVFPLAALEGEEPLFAVDRVPYLCSNFVDAGKLWQVLRPRVEQSLAARGLILLYGITASPPAPLANRALTALGAWRGIRILSSAPPLGDLSRILGAQAVGGPSPREAMAGGKVDAAFLGAEEAAAGKAWEYAGHYLHAPAWFPKHLVVARRDAVNALADGARAALITAASEAEVQGWRMTRQATEDGVQKLRDYAVKTAEPPVGLLIQLEALGRELLFLWSDSAGEAGARLVEDYYAIR